MMIVDLTKEPSNCPGCKSEDISASEFDLSSGSPFRKCRCTQCELVWTELFIFDSWAPDTLDEGKDYIVIPPEVEEDKRPPSRIECMDAVSWYREHDMEAYAENGTVYVIMDNEDETHVSVSDAEIKYRAECHIDNLEQEQGE